MKKSSTLKQQIKQCKKIVASWSPEKRASVQLEGLDIYYERTKQRQLESKPVAYSGNDKVVWTKADEARLDKALSDTFGI